MDAARVEGAQPVADDAVSRRKARRARSAAARRARGPRPRARALASRRPRGNAGRTPEHRCQPAAAATCRRRPAPASAHARTALRRARTRTPRWPPSRRSSPRSARRRASPAPTRRKRSASAVRRRRERRATASTSTSKCVSEACSTRATAPGRRCTPGLPTPPRAAAAEIPRQQVHRRAREHVAGEDDEVVGRHLADDRGREVCGVVGEQPLEVQPVRLVPADRGAREHVPRRAEEVVALLLQSPEPGDGGARVGAFRPDGRRRELACDRPRQRSRRTPSCRRGRAPLDGEAAEMGAPRSRAGARRPPGARARSTRRRARAQRAAPRRRRRSPRSRLRRRRRRAPGPGPGRRPRRRRSRRSATRPATGGSRRGRSRARRPSPRA